MGWGVGAALGAKLAAPEKTIIATVGDGSYLFSVPTTCHFAVKNRGLKNERTGMGTSVSMLHRVLGHLSLSENLLNRVNPSSRVSRPVT
ncbi:MAG: hypothetical protein HQ561_17515 [Desulfobacteraceae bacterium]|nr:hypothetical protein [Desulfobacteraceae bacterium]